MLGARLSPFPFAAPPEAGRDAAPPLLVLLVVLLHGALALGLGGRPVPATLPVPAEVTVELLRPPRIPPAVPLPPAAPRTPVAARAAVPRPAAAPAAPPAAAADPAGLLPPAAPAPAAVEAAPAPFIEASAHAGYLRNPAPVYPERAKRMGWEGRTLLRVLVLASGRPERIELDRSSGYGELDDAARDTVKGWTFAPARRGTVPVDGWVQVPIEFKLGK